MLLDAVLAGELDLAFALIHDLDPRFESLELVRDPWVLLAPRDSELVEHQPVPLAMLDGLQMVEWQTSTQIYDVESRLARFGINIDVVFRTDDNLTLQHFVGAGLGHAIAGRLVVEPGSSDMDAARAPARGGHRGAPHRRRLGPRPGPHPSRGGVRRDGPRGRARALLEIGRCKGGASFRVCDSPGRCWTGSSPGI